MTLNAMIPASNEPQRNFKTLLGQNNSKHYFNNRLKAGTRLI
jgi:hypothetical protein